MTHDPFNQKVGTGDLQGSGIKFDQSWNHLPDTPMGWEYLPSWWFQTFFIFTPIPGEMIQFDSYFHLAHVFLDVFCRCFGSQTDPMNSGFVTEGALLVTHRIRMVYLTTFD